MCVPLSIDGCPINILIITCSIHVLCFVLIRLVRLGIRFWALPKRFCSVLSVCVCVFVMPLVVVDVFVCVAVVVVVVVMDVHELHNKPRARSHCLSSKLFI